MWSNKKKEETEKQIEEDDPYSQYLGDDENKIEGPKSETRWERKKKKMAHLFNDKTNNFLQGGLIGLMVGGSFGAVIGLYTAITQRQLILWPISIIASGVSFGFVLGCGNMIRAIEDYEDIQKNYSYQLEISNNGTYSITHQPYWKEKFAIIHKDF